MAVRVRFPLQVPAKGRPPKRGSPLFFFPFFPFRPLPFSPGSHRTLPDAFRRRLPVSGFRGIARKVGREAGQKTQQETKQETGQKAPQKTGRKTAREPVPHTPFFRTHRTTFFSHTAPILLTHRSVLFTRRTRATRCARPQK